MRSGQHRTGDARSGHQRTGALKALVNPQAERRPRNGSGTERRGIPAVRGRAEGNPPKDAEKGLRRGRRGRSGPREVSREQGEGVWKRRAQASVPRAGEVPSRHRPRGRARARVSVASARKRCA